MIHNQGGDNVFKIFSAPFWKGNYSEKKENATKDEHILCF